MTNVLSQLPPLEAQGAFGGFIGPRTLLGQVAVTAPWLFDGTHPDASRVPVPFGESSGSGLRLSDLPPQPLGWWSLLLAQERDPGLLTAVDRPSSSELTDYLALCLAAHWASVATYVPTDVDAKIRHALWFEENSREELSRRTELALGLAQWDVRGVSTRWVGVAPDDSSEIVSGHDGERLSVLCGGMLGLLAASDLGGAERLEHEIDAELSRQARAFDAYAATPGREIDLLRLAALLTHNVGDVMQGLSAKSGRHVGAVQRERYGDLARSGPSPGSGGSTATGAGRPVLGRPRYGGAFLRAAALYRELLASEGHRNYPLREPRCLRRSPDHLLPLGPFLDDWGAGIATHPAFTLEERAEVVAALVQGCRRVPSQRGYDRALAGFDGAIAGGIECAALTDLLPSALRRDLQSSERRRARALRRASFESGLAKAARKILAAG